MGSNTTGHDELGRFNSDNPGRPTGATNKITQTIRDKFEQLLQGVGVDQMAKDLMKMEPEQRLRIIASLAEFITPKLARTDTNLITDEPVQINFNTTKKINTTKSTNGAAN